MLAKTTMEINRTIWVNRPIRNFFVPRIVDLLSGGFLAAEAAT
jgi:hypothetical protein